MLQKIVATIGIMFDVAAALFLTIPVILERQEERDRKAEALAFAENPAVMWRGSNEDRLAAAAHHRTLLGADRGRAILSTVLLLTGVACSTVALWLS